MNRINKLYNTLYALQAELDRAEYYVEIENIEEEIEYIEGVIFDTEYWGV